MTTNALTDYMLYLLDVACEGPATRDMPPPKESNIPAPTTFIADTLRALASPGIFITRLGTERAADILFTHPDVNALFRNADATAALRAIIHGEILPSQETTENFRNHWNYIIGPALDEHVAVARLTTD